MPARSSTSTNAWLEPSQPGHSPASMSINAIIDAQTSQGGHHMFNHCDAGRSLANRGTPLGWDDRVDSSGHGRPIRQVGPDEDHARARVGRTESQRHVGAVKKSEPAHFRRAGDRAL